MKLQKLLKRALFIFIFSSILLLLVIAPGMLFQYKELYEIYPSIEVILIFYFTTYYKVRNWQIFIFGLLLDQIYALPLGTNSLSLFLGILLLQKLSQVILIKENITNCFIFMICNLFITLLKAIIILSIKIEKFSYLPFIFQYLTTIFTYPIFKVLIDKIIIKYKGIR